MPEDINGLDVTDAGLKAVMGNRFRDETQSEPSKVISKKETTTTHEEKVAQKAKDKPVETQWQPVKPDPNWQDKLKNAVKWGFTFGCISCLVFYWQSAGLMAESIAVPTIAVCTALGGWGVGKNAR